MLGKFKSGRGDFFNLFFMTIKKTIMKKEGRLSRELSLFQLTVAGTGVMLGAGIYALIGVAAGITGNSIWLAFLIASLIAALTGLSYAELSSRFHKDAGEYDYITAAFNKKIGSIIGALVVFSGFFGIATVAMAFGSYFSNLLHFPIIYYAVFLILACVIVNYIGTRASFRIDTAFTFIQIAGLLIIILLGMKHLGKINYFEMPNGITGLLEASALIFFAYTGFESIVKFSEEAKNPARTVPRAIIYSIIISAVLYILVSVSAISILDWQKLSASTAPLAEVASVSFGNAAFMALAVIALFSTSKTVLMVIITTSRMIYGMAERNALPKIFLLINKKHKTPINAIIATGIVSIPFLLINNLETMAYLANFSLFTTFALINLSVIVLRYKSDKDNTFKMPVNIGKFPLLAALGLISCLVMLIFVVKGLV